MNIKWQITLASLERFHKLRFQIFAFTVLNAALKFYYLNPAYSFKLNTLFSIILKNIQIYSYLDFYSKFQNKILWQPTELRICHMNCKLSQKAPLFFEALRGKASSSASFVVKNRFVLKEQKVWITATLHLCTIYVDVIRRSLSFPFQKCSQCLRSQMVRDEIFPIKFLIIFLEDDSWKLGDFSF